MQSLAIARKSRANEKYLLSWFARLLKTKMITRLSGESIKNEYPRCRFAERRKLQIGVHVGKKGALNNVTRWKDWRRDRARLEYRYVEYTVRRGGTFEGDQSRLKIASAATENKDGSTTRSTSDCSALIRSTVSERHFSKPLLLLIENLRVYNLTPRIGQTRRNIVKVRW